ncbi:MAG: hypothetical protein ACOY5B_18875 [Spirochaetota bacterium]
MNDKHLKEQELSAYLSGTVTKTVREDIERHLKLCNTCFQNFMNMKEAIFLQKGGEKISSKMKDSVLQRIRDSRQSHISIIVRFLKDKIVVFSGDQDSLSYQGLKATFAFRDGEADILTRSKEGPISITRVIDDREVTITIHPLSQKDRIGLSLIVKPSESLQAAVSFNGEEIETIADISNQSMLSTHLPKQGELDIKFSKQNQTVFTITLNLEAGE